MTPMPPLVLETASVEQTLDLGARIGRVLRGGEVLALIGPLGAGKTQFVKGLAAGLARFSPTPAPGAPSSAPATKPGTPPSAPVDRGEQSDAPQPAEPPIVTSPTFTLIHDYPGRLDLYHVDAYRLTGPAALDGLGLDELLTPRSALAIEWADRVASALPPDRLTIRMEPTAPTSRRFTFEPSGARSIALESALRSELASQPAAPPSSASASDVSASQNRDEKPTSDPSRDRQEAILAGQGAPLPDGRGSERTFRTRSQRFSVSAFRFDLLVSGPLDDAAVQRLSAVGTVRFARAGDEATLIREAATADALVVRTEAQVTAAVIESAAKLKVIGRGGVGLDNIDLPAARRRGVAVVYTPAAASDSVAEFTVGLMLALERRLPAADLMLRGGRFGEARSALVGRELRGRIVGIVGLGRIGRRVGRICRRGLGMTVLYNDIVEIAGLDYEAEAVDQTRLWAESDVISLHVPLTAQTRHLVNEAVLAHVRPAATLINTSRGPVVDTLALARALSAGRLAGAALDVFETEPPPPDHPLLAAPNVLLTPHLAARTAAGLARMNDVVDDVIAVLTGRPPQYPAPFEE